MSDVIDENTPPPTPRKPVVPPSHCFKCGDSTLVALDTNLSEEYGTVIEFNTGYASTALWDGSIFAFRACEKCLKEWMLTFKHRPMHANYMIGEGEALQFNPADDHDMRIARALYICDRHGSIDQAAQGHLGCGLCHAEHS